MQLRKVINHGNSRWRVSAYVKGQRSQRFFANKCSALEWMQALKADPSLVGFWSNRTTSEQRDIIAAFEVAKQRDLSLLRVALQTKHGTATAPRPLREIVSIYLASLKTRAFRKNTIKQARSNLNQLASKYGALDTNTITPTHLEQWFAQRKWTRSTIDGVIAKIGPFFTWCVREGYCESNPCKAVKRPQSDDSPPAIFTPSEAKKLLQAALRYDRRLIPYLAIGLFAGIRPLEIQRLSRADISDRYIEIKAAKAKTRKRRLVSISPNLKQWLALGGDLPLTNKRKRLARVVQIAGLNWQPDIMRHSFASYHLAMHTSADKTALELGHRDSKMLFAHYRELVTQEAGQSYWAIRP